MYGESGQIYKKYDYDENRNKQWVVFLAKEVVFALDF